jgi:hypothetical protein
LNCLDKALPQVWIGGLFQVSPQGPDQFFEPHGARSLSFDWINASTFDTFVTRPLMNRRRTAAVTALNEAHLGFKRGQNAAAICICNAT